MQKLALKMVGLGLLLAIFACIGVIILAISAGLLDPYQMFPNLPRPPEIDTSELPVPVPEVGPPDILGFKIPEAMKPQNPVVLETRVTRRPLLRSVPAPQQLSSQGRVIGTNVLLAIVMALIFGITSSVLGNMLRDEEPRIRAWLAWVGIDRLVGWLGRVFQWSLGKAKIRRGCLTLPLIVLIFALYGIIFAFLEEGTSLFTPDGAFLAVTMAFSVGLVSFGGDIARRIAGRLWRADSRFNIYPINLLVAAGSVILSRLFVLTPGIVFGTPGGADVDIPDQRAIQRERTLAFLSILAIAVIGGLGWLASGVVVSALDVPVDDRVANTVARLLSAAQNTGLAIFLVALETLFFEMLPLAYSTGQAIFRWSKAVWGVVFIPIAFLFNHALLNPQSGFLDSFLVSDVRFMWFVLFVLVAITFGLWFYFNIVDDVLKDWLGVRRSAR